MAVRGAADRVTATAGRKATAPPTAARRPSASSAIRAAGRRKQRRSAPAARAEADAHGGRSDHLPARRHQRSEEHTSELQSLMRISYAVFCLKKTTNTNTRHWTDTDTMTNVKKLKKH